MKFLIWFAVLLVPSIITTMLNKGDIFLGGIPSFLLYLGAYYLAKFLCAKWDVKAFQKRANKRGMTLRVYASSIFPPSLLDLCETNKYNRVELKRMLKQCVKAETITNSDANVLLYMFNVGL